MEYTPQDPAEGISKRPDYPDLKSYTIDCSCGCDNDISVTVEIDDCCVNTTFCSKTKTRYWYQRLSIDYSENWLLLNFKQLFNDVYNRIDIAWTALTRGYMETESCVILSPQQVHNFTATLTKAVCEFETAANERHENFIAEKAKRDSKNSI